jgi:hypothetical protein
MSTKRSIYEELTIESNDQKRTIDLKQGTISIDYYEDIFSPTITATLQIVNGGDSISAPDSEGNPDGPAQSIYNGLPLRGGERISLKIAGNSKTNPGLDFSSKEDNYFYVSAITNVLSESQRETFTLNLVSREAITNETSRVGKKYPTTSTINTSVEGILKDYLKTEKVGVIDKTSNQYGFIGNLRKPFTVLVWLASKAVPDKSGDATAGFVFFQTKDGFQFRSIDGLITQDPKAEYVYTQVNQSEFEYEGKPELPNNDFKILNYSTSKNQNLLEKLRMGAYSSYRMFYNPLDFTFTDPGKGVFKLGDYVGGVTNLGQQLKLPKISNSSNVDLGDIPTRYLTQVLDIGTMEKGVSTEGNSDPFKYQSQSIMRYNILFTQTLSMIVPSNTNLRAGDIISCKFPTISRSNKEEFDKEQSGLYMIKELCHHFDTSGSYTSMKLVRDTFGQYGTNNTK